MKNIGEYRVETFPKSRISNKRRNQHQVQDIKDLLKHIGIKTR
jgi:hypothetical protein